MNDKNKTKEELINELAEMRQRIAEIEALETEQKKTEELLRNTERNWRDSFNSLEDVMLIIDKDYNIENINEIGLKLLGKSKEEVIGKKCYQIISGADSPAEECPGKKSLETKQVESLDRYEKRFGRIFSIKSSPILDENGEVMKFVDLMRDITEWKKAEEALRESEERLSSFMESATDGFFLLDSELNYVEINKAGLWLFPAGTKKEDIIGKNIVEIAPDIKKTGRYDKYMEVLKTGKPFFVDDIVPYPKFGGVHLALRAFKVGNNLGIITTDITERKKAEEKIKASLKEKEMLLKEIHHRVKNNLQIISGLLSLQSRYIQDKEAVEAFSESQNRIRSIALVHEQLYRSEGLVRVNFTEYLQGLVVNLFDSYAVNPEIISLKVSSPDIFLNIDTAIPCGLITHELVSNCLKHAFPQDKKREIHIDLRREESSQFTLIVRDNGVGFPKDLDFQNTETLGLQLVNVLVDQLEGSIELARREGTTFKITFGELRYKDR